jgi:hypothetical protein
VLGQDSSGQYFVLDLVPVPCVCAWKTQSQQPLHLSLQALLLLLPSLSLYPSCSEPSDVTALI